MEQKHVKMIFQGGRKRKRKLLDLIKTYPIHRDCLSAGLILGHCERCIGKKRA